MVQATLRTFMNNSTFYCITEISLPKDFCTFFFINLAKPEFPTELRRFYTEHPISSFWGSCSTSAGNGCGPHFLAMDLGGHRRPLWYALQLFYTYSNRIQLGKDCIFIFCPSGTRTNSFMRWTFLEPWFCCFTLYRVRMSNLPN